MNWEMTINRIERAAISVLSNRSMPTTRQELMTWFKSNLPSDTLTRLAIEIIFDVHYLREYVAKEDLRRSLDRLTIVLAEYEEFDILRKVPAYESKRENLTRSYFKDMHDGARSRQGRKSSGRKRKHTEKQVVDALIQAHKQHPRWGITQLRKEAAASLGISLTTLKDTTMHDPRSI